MENKEVGFDKMRKLTGAIGLLEAIREMMASNGKTIDLIGILLVTIPIVMLLVKAVMGI